MLDGRDGGVEASGAGALAALVAGSAGALLSLVVGGTGGWRRGALAALVAGGVEPGRRCGGLAAASHSRVAMEGNRGAATLCVVVGWRPEGAAGRVD